MRTDDHDVIGEDLAPEPGLTQAFPIVAPQSDERHGPQDIRPPQQVLSRMLERERLDDSWAFRRERAQAEIEKEERVEIALRRRAEKAERSLRDAITVAGHRKVDIEASAEERRRRGDAEELALETRLKEAKKREAEMVARCSERLEETRAQLEIERRHTAEVQVLLARERARSDAGRCDADVAAAASSDRLENRDKDVQAAQEQAERHVDRARRAAAERLRAVEARCRAELTAAQERLASQQARCEQRELLEVTRRRSAADIAEERKLRAASRLATDQACMKVCTTAIKADCDGLVKKVQQREEKTRAFTSEKIDQTGMLHSSAAARSAEAQRRERDAAASLSMGVTVLGRHLATQRQHSLAVDSRLAAVLDRPMPATARPQLAQ